MTHRFAHTCTWSRGIAFISAGLTLASCSDATDRADRFVVRDSVGIAIAENGPGALESAPMLELRPDLDIGLVEGDSAYQLFRVSGARQLPDGGVAVMNTGTRELRLFAPDGTHRRTVGRDGEGPGEFREPFGLWLIGDSLFAFDNSLQRLSVFSFAGDFVRSAEMSRRALNASVVTVLEDGSFITSDMIFDLPESGFEPFYVELVRWNPDGSWADSLGRQEYAVMGRVGTGQNALYTGHLFSAYLTSKGNTQAYWLGRGVEPDVRMHAPDGRLVRRVRWHIADRLVRPADVEKYRTQLLENTEPDRRAALENRFQVQPVSETFAAYDRLFATLDGWLWVGEFMRPGQERRHWLRFDPDGRLTGRMETHASFFPFDGGSDWLLAVEPDDFDVEHVRRFQLRESVVR
jgi:hypothetical protein